MNTEEGSSHSYIQKLLCKDVHRTYSEHNLFMEEPSTGNNRLYNLLNAYALFDVDVGYMQGMNFIAALVLKVFDDEALSFFVFIRIL